MQNNGLNTRPIMSLQDSDALRGICMLMIMIHHLNGSYCNVCYNLCNECYLWNY